MDEETVWIKKEETDEIRTERSSMVHIYPKNIKVKEELQKDMDKECFQDTFGFSGPNYCIKEDPELNLEPEETENTIDTYAEFHIPECEDLRIKEEEVVVPKRFSPITTRFSKTISKATSMLPKEMALPGVITDNQETVAGKLTNFLRTGPAKQVFSSHSKTFCTQENQYELFTCSSCNQRFSSKYKLITHVFIHIDCVEPPEHICTWCGEVFLCQDTLRQHNMMQSGISQNVYEYDKISNGFHGLRSCNIQCASERLHELISNKSCNTTEKPHNFEVHKKYLIQSGLGKKRSTINTSKKSYKCGDCDMSFTSCYHLNEHMIKHSGERPYRCNECGKTFAAHRILKQHEKIHSGIRPYKCDVCGKSFVRSDHLITHNLIHTGERPYKCSMCGKRFTNCSNLKKHGLLHSGERPHNCKICGKSFREGRQLKIHEVIHTGKRPYKCVVCGKSFTQSCNLKTHMVTHTGERSFRCDVCEKAFTTSGNLKNHTFIHTGEKPHKCDVCMRTFTFSASLKTHKLIHIGVRPHKCLICLKSFFNSSGLKKHSVIHTGQKPYECDICRKKFTQAGNLRVHARRHSFK